MSLGEIIRTRRERMNLTQDQLSARVGISKPYLSHIETGKAKNPPTDGILRKLEKSLGFGGGELTRLAHYARTPADVRQEHELLQAQVDKLRGMIKQLASPPRKGRSRSSACRIGQELSHSLVPLPAGVTVPIINKVAAGYPHDFTDLDYPPSVADEYIRCPDMHDPQAFAARVVGDSMQPAYHQDDIVIFAPNTPALSGDDCFVRFADDGGTTFKRVYMDDPQTLRLQPLNSAYPAASYNREQINGLWPAVFRIQKLRKH